MISSYTHKTNSALQGPEKRIVSSLGPGAGYVYRVLLDFLFMHDGQMDYDYAKSTLINECNIPVGLIESVVNNFNLFTLEGGILRSNFVDSYIHKSTVRSKAVSTRYKKDAFADNQQVTDFCTTKCTTNCSSNCTTNCTTKPCNELTDSELRGTEKAETTTSETETPEISKETGKESNTKKGIEKRKEDNKEITTIVVIEKKEEKEKNCCAAKEEKNPEDFLLAFDEEKPTISPDDAKCQFVIDEFNTRCTNFPKVRFLNGERRKKVLLRIKAMSQAGDWKKVYTEILDKMQASPFLSGKKIDWKANFTWLFDSPNNWVKVYEGNYDGEHGGAQQGLPQKEVNDLWSKGY